MKFTTLSKLLLKFSSFQKIFLVVILAFLRFRGLLKTNSGFIRILFSFSWELIVHILSRLEVEYHSSNHFPRGRISGTLSPPVRGCSPCSKQRRLLAPSGRAAQALTQTPDCEFKAQ